MKEHLQHIRQAQTCQVQVQIYPRKREWAPQTEVLDHLYQELLVVVDDRNKDMAAVDMAAAVDMVIPTITIRITIKAIIKATIKTTIKTTANNIQVL